MQASLFTRFIQVVVGLGLLCGIAPADEKVVVRIGDKAISVGLFETLAQQLRKTGYKHLKELDRQGREELLEGVIARELLILEGLERGYDREPMIAAAVDKVRRRALVNRLYEQEAVQESYVFSEEELRAFYIRKQFDVEVLSQHIVCSTEEKAREALVKLQGGATYESLVPTYSVENVQKRFGPAGWIGWFKIGEVYPQLKEPLKTMSPGALYPEPVRTAVGYHIFRLKARRPVDFEANREWIEKKALVQGRADDMEGYVEQLRQGYSLKLHPAGLAALLALEPQQTQWEGEDEAVFSWRGGQLTAQDYMEQLRQGSARHPAELDSSGVHRDADNLAGRQIMMAEARRLGLENAAEVRDVADKERAKFLVGRIFQDEADKRVQTPNDEEIRAFYAENIAEFTREDGKVTEFSFLEKSIRTAMLAKRKTAAMDGLLERLRQKYKSQIEINPEALDLAFSR
jgi:parvulin-like peptidyl-prolyl isomerase